MSEFRERTAYGADSDWLFARPSKEGKTPYWPDSVLEKIVKPAAKLAGITKTVGWHTLRHSYSLALNESVD